MRTIRVVAVLAALATTALVAGCGDTAKKNDYIDQVNKAQQRFVASVNKLNTGGTDPKQIAVGLGKLRTAITKVADEIEAITPPDQVKASHAKLVKVLRDFGTALDGAGKGLASSDPATLSAAAADLSTATSTASSGFDAAVSEINAELHK